MKKISIITTIVTIFFTTIPTTNATHDPNDFWVQETTGNSFRSIHGVSTSNIWTHSLLSGPGVAAGQIFQRTLTQSPFWTTNVGTFPAPPNSPRASSTIWVANSNNAWAVGGGDVSRWNGASWIDVSIPEIHSFFSVYGLSTTDVWIGSTELQTGNVQTGSARLHHYDGVSYTVCASCDIYPESEPGANRIVGIFPVTSTDVWLIVKRYTERFLESSFYQSEIWHYDGTWTKFQTVTTRLNAIWGTSSTNIWTVGDLGTALRYTGGPSFTSVSTNTVTNLETVHGTSSSNVWAAGGTGASQSVIRFDGASWTNEPLPVSTSVITDIFLLDSTNIWILTGNSIEKMQINPAVGLPVLTGLMLQRNDFNVETSQAQCNGDEIDLRVETDRTIGAGGITVTVIESDSNVVIQQWVNVQTHPDWFNLNNHLMHTSKVYAPGEYVLVGTIDVLGALEDDQFSTAPFNIPLGDCIDTPYDDTGLRNLIFSRTNQTNSIINTTTENVLENLTIVHVHIDSHFNMTDALIVNQFFQTNGYINTTRIQILNAINDLDFNIDCGNETSGNCTFEAQTMIDLPGLTDQQVGAFLLFLTMLIISFFQRWLFVAVASVIGILEVFILGGIFGFEFTGLLLVIGIMLQIFVDHRDAALEKKRESEGGELGD